MPSGGGSSARLEQDQETSSSSTANTGTEATTWAQSSDMEGGVDTAVGEKDGGVPFSARHTSGHDLDAPAPLSLQEANMVPLPRPEAPRRTRTRTGKTPACITAMDGCVASLEAHNERQAQKLRARRAERRREGSFEQGELGPAGVAALAGGAEVPHGATGTNAGWGVRETIEEDPAWVRYAMVPVVFLILLWVLVVFLWRLVVPMLRQNPESSTLAHPVPLGTRADGIVLLVMFASLWLITVWSYVRLITTGPGFAKDHVPVSEPPTKMPAGPYAVQAAPTQPQDQAESRMQSSVQPAASPVPIPPRESDASLYHSGIRGSSEAPVPSPLLVAPPTPPTILRDGGDHDTGLADGGVSHLAIVSTSTDRTDVVAALATGFSGVNEVPEDERQRIDSSTNKQAISHDANPREAEEVASFSAPTSETNPYTSHGSPPEPHELPVMPPDEPQRSPPTHPVLASVNRYCHRCRRIKPPRAHHCRRCGTCVLRMDHHCPWVGGCVGARNHKFFVTFVLWVTLLEIFMLVTTATLFARGVRMQGWTADGFIISLFPIIGFFLMFTTALLITHLYMLSLNISTIEHLYFDRLSSTENYNLSRWFSPGGGGQRALQTQGKTGCLDTGFGLYSRQRSALRQVWEREWGRPKTDGNLWWIGGPREMAIAHWIGLDDSASQEVPRAKEGIAGADIDESDVRQSSHLRYNLALTLGNTWWEWVRESLRSTPYA